MSTCVSVKVDRSIDAQLAMSDTAKLADILRPSTTYLCKVDAVDATRRYGITEVQLVWLDRVAEEDLCPQCFLRLAVMAANGLMFTNADLNSLLKLLGGES